MNKKQLIVAWVMGILICISLFMTKDTIILVKYDKAQIDKQRVEYRRRVEDATGTWTSFNHLYATHLYPYGGEKVATNILGFKFKGRHYRFKFKIILSLLIIGGLVIYTLRDKKK